VNERGVLIFGEATSNLEKQQKKCVDCSEFCGRCLKGIFTFACNDACSDFSPRVNAEKTEVLEALIQ
jgi:hypothetical protein